MTSKRTTIVQCALLIGALLATGYTLAPAAHASVFQAPAGIDATGTTDVSAALNSFLAGVPDGATVTFPAGSRYRVENIVYLNNRHDLTIDGRGAIFFASTTGSGVPATGPNAVRQHWPRHRDEFLVADSANVTLRNLSVRGPNPNAGTADAAFVLS